jgi:hypothetical protein
LVDHYYSFPALRIVGHYKALASFYYLTSPTTKLLKQFIEQPKVVLAAERYAAIIALLAMVKQGVS